MSKFKSLKSGVFGVLVGSALGVLFAPKSGKETREDIKETASKAGAQVDKQLKALHADLSSKLDDLKNSPKGKKGQDEVKKLIAKAETAKDKVGEAISGLREGEIDDDEAAKIAKSSTSVLEEVVESVAKKTKTATSAKK